MTRFHCNSSRSKIWLFGTRCVICGTENGYGACFGLGTLDWGSHSSLWVPWGRGSLRELCSPVHYLSWWFSAYDMILWNFLVTFFFLLLLLSSILQWLLIICKLCNLIDCETIKHIIKLKKLFNCFSLFQVLIGQKSITWHKVFSATTGDDVLPVIIRLSRPVIIYARASYGFCTAN